MFWLLKIYNLSTYIQHLNVKYTFASTTIYGCKMNNELKLSLMYAFMHIQNDILDESIFYLQ